jgi:hypothetical protein
MSKLFRHALIDAGVLIVTLGFALPAEAHEERTVGKYRFAVGWGDEPTYAGFKNSVQLLLRDSKDKPVNDLGDTLHVEVKFGTNSITLPFEPDFEVGEFGTEGDYRAWLVPTRPGQYSFHFTGTIKGQKVDQTFTSSEKTFESVKEPTDVEFPAKDPSNGELATRVQAESGRAQLVAADVRKTKSDLDTARLLAIIGLAVGGVGLLTALGFGLSARKKSV